MAEAARVYCADPFKQHKKKSKKDRTFLEITEKYVHERRGCGELVECFKNGGKFLCKLCVWRVNKAIAALKEEDSVTDKFKSFSLVDESSNSSSEDDPDFRDDSTDKQLLVKELNLYGVDGSMLLGRYTQKESVMKILKTLEEKFQNLESNIKKSSGFSFPKPADIQVKSGCKYCSKLTDQLVKSFQLAQNKYEKYKILTCVPSNVTIEDVIRLFGCSQHMARKASKMKNEIGAFSCPAIKIGKKLSNELIKFVKEFYTSDENSRVDPSIRGSIMVFDAQRKEKFPEAKRLILTTLSELYNEFLQVHAEATISISAFAKLRPVWCVFTGNRGFHYSCTCVVHENFNLLLAALGIKDNSSNILSSFVCSFESETCAFGACPKCHNINVLGLMENYEFEEVTYNFWGPLPGTFGISIHENTMPLTCFQDYFQEYVPSILSHHFIMKNQMKFVDHLKTTILPNEQSALLQVDFAQNYSYIMQGAVQGYHWNNQQATVHPFVLSYYDNVMKELKTRSYIVISDELSHDAHTFHVFRTEVLKRIKLEGLNFKKLYYLSDGAGSQYKNKYNFANLLYHEHDFGIQAEWHFHASCHGKGQCDAMGAIVKRILRLASLNVDPQTKNRVYIRNIDDMSRVLISKITSKNMVILTVSSEGVADLKAAVEGSGRFKGVRTLNGTRLYHSTVPFSKTEMKVRRYSLSNSFEIIGFFDVNPTLKESFSCGEFVAVVVENTFAIGRVLEYSDENGYSVSLLRKQLSGNSFLWPEKEIVQLFSHQQILMSVEAPTAGKTGRVLKLSCKEFKNLERLITKK